MRKEYLAATMLGACFVLGLWFIFLVLIYDPSTPGSFGLPRVLVEPVMVGFAPLVIATATGLRDEIYRLITMPKPSKVRVYRHAKVLAGFGVVGPLFAVFVLFLLARQSINVEDAAMWIGIAGGIWAFTTGSVFGRFVSSPGEEGEAPAPRTKKKRGGEPNS